MLGKELENHCLYSSRRSERFIASRRGVSDHGVASGTRGAAAVLLSMRGRLESIFMTMWAVYRPAQKFETAAQRVHNETECRTLVQERRLRPR